MINARINKLACLWTLFFIAGCGLFNTMNLDTNEKRYAAARAELNLFLEKYIAIQDQVPYKKHEKIKHAFIQADTSLDIIEQFLDVPGYDPEDEFETFFRAKKIIMEALKDG